MTRSQAEKILSELTKSNIRKESGPFTPRSAYELRVDNDGHIHVVNSISYRVPDFQQAVLLVKELVPGYDRALAALNLKSAEADYDLSFDGAVKSA